MATTAEQIQLELQTALAATGLCTVHRVTSRKNDVRALFTITNDRAGVSRTPEWLRLISRLLVRLDGGFYVFLGERYYVAEGKLVRAWVLMLDTEGTETVARVVSRFRTLLLQVTEELKTNNAIPPTISIPVDFSFGTSQTRIRPMAPTAE